MVIQLEYATLEDVDTLMHIVHDAQQIMHTKGIDQWQNGYPNRSVLTSDIQQHCLYIARASAYEHDLELSPDTPVAMAAILRGPEADYKHIEPLDVDNPHSPHAWDNPDASYMVIHRVAVAKTAQGKHVAGPFYDACLALAFGECGTLHNADRDMLTHRTAVSEVRVDTHPDNKSMQGLIESRGFTRQGLIYVNGNTDAGRIAYALTREHYMRRHH